MKFGEGVWHGSRTNLSQLENYYWNRRAVPGYFSFIAGTALAERKELTVLKDAVKRLQKDKDQLYSSLRGEDKSRLPPQHLPVIRRNLDKTAFTVTIDSDLQAIDGEILVFNTVITDNLGDYDPTFGFFACRNTGTYMFILTLVAPTGLSNSAQIVHPSGGTETVVGVISEAYDIGLDYSGSHTSQVILSCLAGDLVFINAFSPSGDPTVWYAGGRRTLFTGYYI